MINHDFSAIVSGLSSRPEDTQAYIKQMYKDGLAFLKTFEANKPTEDKLHEHDQWIKSPEGQETLTKLIKQIIGTIDQYPKESVPGHDRRHVFKDLASSFHILKEEGFTHDWRALTVIPSLLHDSGRLVEEKFIDGNSMRDGGKLHAYLSFKMLEDILAGYAIPKDLKQEMLHAVLVHQSGAGQDRTMAWAVQRADREQLMSGELLARNFPACVHFHGTSLVTTFSAAVEPPSLANRGTFLPAMASYEHRLYKNGGRYGESRANILKAQAIACIQMASLGNGAALSTSDSLEAWLNDPFIRWIETGWKRSDIGEQIVPLARALLNNASALLRYIPDSDAGDILISEIEKPNSTFSPNLKDALKRNMGHVSPEGRASYVRALQLMQHYRAGVDQQDQAILKSFSDGEDVPPYLRNLASACAVRMGVVQTPDIIIHFGIPSI